MAPVETQSLHRAIAILDCFRSNQPELGVREVARQVDLHPATVGRILADLTTLGVLTQDPETRRYRMGPKVLHWSAVYMSRLDLRDEARPYLEKLHKATRETISLYIPDGNMRVCIERIESPQTVRMVARVGERMPFYAGASGKAMLAFMTQEHQKAILEKAPFERLTPKTPQDKQELQRELDEIREQGFAVSHGERVEGASSVAAPVFDAGGNVIGAINISGPSVRFTSEKTRMYSQLLLESTGELSRAMGYMKE